MSVSVHCFEGLTIKRCIWPSSCCCCPKKKPRPRIVLIQEMHLDLCIVNAPHQIITSLGANRSTDPWDFLIVDRDVNMVMFTGARFHDFCMDKTLLTAPVDACKGTPLVDLFHKSMVDIFNPLLDVAWKSIPGQLHTIYKGQSLTFFVYPIVNENKTVVGATILYRPTQYNVTDISQLISTAIAP